MLEILKFIFSSFWHFIGCIILLGVLTEFVGTVIGSISICISNYFYCKNRKE